jgi:hypothetical protein
VLQQLADWADEFAERRQTEAAAANDPIDLYPAGGYGKPHPGWGAVPGPWAVPPKRKRGGRVSDDSGGFSPTIGGAGIFGVLFAPMILAILDANGVTIPHWVVVMTWWIWGLEVACIGVILIILLLGLIVMIFGD